MENGLTATVNPPELPCKAEMLVPQRPPMLIVDRLVERDRDGNFSAVVADPPVGGVFNPSGNRIIPEYFVELIAQAMAAVNGFDSISDGKERGTGFLVGIDDFIWYGTDISSGNFKIEIVKDFEFGQVTVIHGKVFDSSGKLIASGEVKAWEE